MNINEIMNILPHRYPFLLVDRVLELVEGERIINASEEIQLAVISGCSVGFEAKDT